MKAEIILTPAEKEKIERTRLIKSQFALFSQLYPEYVEKNSVRYPIPDALLAKMPELHGGIVSVKPVPMKIDMEAEDFERALYVWEFCNNFSEYLGTPQFKIEELVAALRYTPEIDPRHEVPADQFEDEFDWSEQMQIRHINEKGFHIVNCLFTSLAESYLQDLFPDEV